MLCLDFWPNCWHKAYGVLLNRLPSCQIPVSSGKKRVFYFLFLHLHSEYRYFVRVPLLPLPKNRYREFTYIFCTHKRMRKHATMRQNRRNYLRDENLLIYFVHKREWGSTRHDATTDPNLRDIYYLYKYYHIKYSEN